MLYICDDIMTASLHLLRFNPSNSLTLPNGKFHFPGYKPLLRSAAVFFFFLNTDTKPMLVDMGSQLANFHIHNVRLMTYHGHEARMSRSDFFLTKNDAKSQRRLNYIHRVHHPRICCTGTSMVSFSSFLPPIAVLAFIFCGLMYADVRLFQLLLIDLRVRFFSQRIVFVGQTSLHGSHGCFCSLIV